MNAACWMVSAALVCAPLPALAQISENFAPVSDADVLNKLHSIDLTEIQMGKLVLERSENDAVRKFADRMIRDHGKAEQKVSALAAKKGIALTTAAGDDRALAELRGGPFDRAYIDGMAAGHEEALTFLNHAAQQNKSPEIQKLIQALRPTVAEHEALARKIQGDRSALGG